MRRILIWLVVATAVASHAAAQDFTDLHVKPGQLIYVTENGVTTTGRVLTLTPASLTVDSRQFTPSPGLAIERDGDSLWNGALIGFVIGVPMGMTVGAEACQHSPLIYCGIGSGILYAGIGALIDYAHKGRTTIYPVIAKRARGVGLAVRF